MSGAAPPPVVVDAEGRVLRLGRKLGQGGEGAVFELEGEPGIAAKIHHQPLTPLRAEKIRVMAGMRTAQIDRLAAWPTNLLSLPSGVPIGLTMPKVTDHKDIHHLYSPKSRRTEFAAADWRFLIRVAANLARAVATIHDANGVIADINHSGVLVGQDARVRLIDCDSFQIVDAGKTYLCDVGVPTFTPPELQGLLFAEIVRTPNHDNFGLAVLIFLTLFMGRHPFAGRFIGLGEMPIERAIGEGRFAYGADCASFQMERPPGAPSLSIVSPAIAGLFERAFARESRGGGRPTAREWATGLEALEGQLRQCAFSPAHWHFDGLQSCPWCRMEAATGIALFSTAVSPGAAAHFDIDAFWRRAEALEHPGPAPALEAADPKHKLQSSVGALQFKQRRAMHQLYALLLSATPIPMAFFVNLPLAGRLLFLAASAGLYFVARMLVRLSNDMSVFADRARMDRERLEKARDDWQSSAGPGRFDAKRAELERLRVRWDESRDVGHRKQQELHDQKQSAALARFLDGFDIEAAEVSGLSPSRVPLLESFGIETAADIVTEKLEGVPKLDKKTRDALTGWRGDLEARFRREAGNAPASLDEELIEREALAEQMRIEAALRAGLQDLQEIQKQTLFARISMKAKTEDAYRTYLQSAADLKDINR
jgi:DNA-binding helix-hairpin-helix protein with protein kinase domain